MCVDNSYGDQEETNGSVQSLAPTAVPGFIIEFLLMTIFSLARIAALRHISLNLFNNKKYVLWNVYLPNVVAFHTPLSKYLTVIVMTLN